MHGAGEGPSVWDGWEGWAIDLHAGLVVPEASMLNYEAAVACDAALFARPLCLVGRGMGALATMMAARRVAPDALALLHPWPPAEAGGCDAAALAAAERPESPLAVAECRRGISVPALPAPALVAGSAAVAARYGAEELEAADVPSAVAAWARTASTSAR